MNRIGKRQLSWRRILSALFIRLLSIRNLSSKTESHYSISSSFFCSCLCCQWRGEERRRGNKSSEDDVYLGRRPDMLPSSLKWVPSIKSRSLLLPFACLHVFPTFIRSPRRSCRRRPRCPTSIAGHFCFSFHFRFYGASLSLPFIIIHSNYSFKSVGASLI